MKRQFFSTFNHKFFIDDYKNWAKVKYISFGPRKNTLTLIINNEDFADLYDQQQETTIYNLEKDNKLELYFDEEQLEEIEFGKIDEREDQEFQAYLQKQNKIQKYNE
ncbi:hypothetical protein PPERSA_00069 [Pseudocohnilembus persalinus]|uniref:Uncharacterized protein n=1 Tax=Pseudocohnilembus persalinus TaxID=266149 RepID=A0A0V0QXZ7_PSEPJ|nr:hypothetical protein PPERSA_00069 [Pseudocohnilembus persalinus]|eukprot:KRX07159.1 hypothetical protein PPERSA_00069 [Pseudocohnilembus persalinus]